MSHHYRGLQRRAIIFSIIFSIVIVATLVPLIVNPQLRLDAGESLGIVPDAKREQLYSSAGGLELIVLVEEVPVQFSLPTRRYTAVYVADQSGANVVLHDLNVERTIDLPLKRYDQVSAAADRSAVLFVDHSGQRPLAALVTVASGEVRPLPEGTTDPGIPGNWDEDIFTGGAGCIGVSPKGDWVACAVGSVRVFGDWELRIHPAGHVEDEKALLRGLGSVPILGWAADESAIYLQNEKGIWKVPVDLPN